MRPAWATARLTLAILYQARQGGSFHSHRSVCVNVASHFANGKVAGLPLELDSKQLAKLLLAFMRDTYHSRPVHPHNPLQFKGPLQQRRPKSTG